MKTRIKKVTAVLSALCLAVCLMPATVFSAPVEYNLWVNNERITGDHLTATCGAGTATYDPTANTLTLNNAEIINGCSVDYLYSGILSRMNDLTIVLVGSNTISNTGGEGISTYDTDSSTYALIPHNLTITGSGQLTITENTAYYGYGVYSTGSLTIDGAALSITSAISGLWVNNDMKLKNSTISVSAVTVTVDVMGTPTEISGSGLVTNTGTITVDNSNVTATSTKMAAIQLGNDAALGSLQMNSGSLTLTGNYGIHAESGIGSFFAVNGGRLNITADTAATNIAADKITFSNGTGGISGALSGTSYVAGVLPNTNPITLSVSTIETAADQDYILRNGITAIFTPNAAIVSGTLNTTNGDGLKTDYYNPMLNPTGLDAGYTKLAEYYVQLPVTGYAESTLSGTITVPLPSGYDGTTAKIIGGTAAVSSDATTVTFPVSLLVNNDVATVGFMAEYKAVESHSHSYGTEWKKDGTNHWHECSCGDVAQVSAHTAGEWIVDSQATATADGLRHKECTVCGYIMQTEAIPATGSAHTHTLVHTAAKAATAATAGNQEYWYCSECGKYFSDSAGKNEITLASTVIAATGTTTDSTNPQTEKHSSIPSTGGNRGIVFLWFLLFLSGAGAVVSAFFIKKRSIHFK